MTRDMRWLPHAWLESVFVDGNECILYLMYGYDESVFGTVIRATSNTALCNVHRKLAKVEKGAGKMF
jgi:hypothetical protein